MRDHLPQAHTAVCSRVLALRKGLFDFDSEPRQLLIDSKPQTSEPPSEISVSLEPSTLPKSRSLHGRKASDVVNALVGSSKAPSTEDLSSAQQQLDSLVIKLENESSLVEAEEEEEQDQKQRQKVVSPRGGGGGHGGKASTPLSPRSPRLRQSLSSVRLPGQTKKVKVAFVPSVPACASSSGADRRHGVHQRAGRRAAGRAGGFHRRRGLCRRSQLGRTAAAHRR